MRETCFQSINIWLVCFARIRFDVDAVVVVVAGVLWILEAKNAETNFSSFRMRMTISICNDYVVNLIRNQYKMDGKFIDLSRWHDTACWRTPGYIEMSHKRIRIWAMCVCDAITQCRLIIAYVFILVTICVWSSHSLTSVCMTKCHSTSSIQSKHNRWLMTSQIMPMSKWVFH